MIICFSGISAQQGLNASGGEANDHSGSESVGDMYGGGVVKWTNKYGTHGLTLSAIDLSTGQAWSNIENVEIGDAAQSFYDGKANSDAIVAQPGHTNSAAKLCLDYTNANYGTGVFSDWYLPSTYEMTSFTPNLMEIQFALINDNNPATIAPSLSKPYWSSTEYAYNNAKLYNFSDGSTTASFLSHFNKKNTYRVRAVRAF